MVYGYARVSTRGQMNDGNSLEEQSERIKEKYPDAEIYSEAYSGAKDDRKVFNDLVELLQSGDTLVVTKLDRFCRSVRNGLESIEKLRNKNVSIHILNMGLIENTPVGELIVTNLLAFAEFERKSIIERTQTGKANAKKNNPNFTEGRPKTVKITDEDIEAVESGKISVARFCREKGISRQSWYNELKAKMNS